MKKQHNFTELPVIHYVLTCQSAPYEQHKKTGSIKTYRYTRAPAEDLNTYTEASKIYMREHHTLR